MSSRDIEEGAPRLWRSETLPQLRPNEPERLVAAFLGRTEAIFSPERYALSVQAASDRATGVAKRSQ
jgi:hypothetical protein